MAAEITAPVEVTTRLPGAVPIGGRIGTLTVALRGLTLHTEDVYRALGELLVEAGNYIINNAALPDANEDDA
ncbi:hypothetical protein [Streptomyces luteocolor]|uniref:hypothetical protein n=1 Tax=Streptomyces luteocolor TaxID=285500 RepID=UPI000852C777|nr:hypothetical protein [Streptomyces luteocolor]